VFLCLTDHFKHVHDDRSSTTMQPSRTASYVGHRYFFTFNGAQEQASPMNRPTPRNLLSPHSPSSVLPQLSDWNLSYLTRSADCHGR